MLRSELGLSLAVRPGDPALRFSRLAVQEVPVPTRQKRLPANGAVLHFNEEIRGK